MIHSGDFLPKALVTALLINSKLRYAIFEGSWKYLVIKQSIRQSINQSINQFVFSLPVSISFPGSLFFPPLERGAREMAGRREALVTRLSQSLLVFFCFRIFDRPTWERAWNGLTNFSFIQMMRSMKPSKVKAQLEIDMYVFGPEITECMPQANQMKESLPS